MLTQDKQTELSRDPTSTKSNCRTQDDESEALVLMQEKQVELSGDTTSAEANSGTQDAVIEALRTELQTIKSKIQESEIERVSVKDMKLESYAELHKHRMLVSDNEQQLAAKDSEINMAGQELRNVETKVQEIEEDLKDSQAESCFERCRDPLAHPSKAEDGIQYTRDESGAQQRQTVARSA